MGAGVNEKRTGVIRRHYPLLVIISAYAFSTGSVRMKRWGGVVSHDRDRGALNMGGVFAIREWRTGENT